MLWLPTVNSSMPPSCEPTNNFLIFISSTFNTCIPTPLAFVSTVLGIFSIISWLFAQLPQICKNWSIGSTSGLSIYFLVEWCLGDLSNLLGAILTHQASWQVCIGAYYVFVDICLVSQWIWYERLKHGSIVRRVWRRSAETSERWNSGEVSIGGLLGSSSRRGDGNDRKHGVDGGSKKQAAAPQSIFRTPNYDYSRSRQEKPPPSPFATPTGRTIHRIGPSSPLLSQSPRTVFLLIVTLAALVRASPSHDISNPSPAANVPILEILGTCLSWLSTVLYLLSRLPQLLQNFQRKSTAGLSPLLFAAAFSGNFFYSAALLTNPFAWYSFPPHGGHGWASSTGSSRSEWLAAALPFFLGAAGVLGLDASVGVQFAIYGDGGRKVVLVEEPSNGDLDSERGRWRRVSGWMRGWIPTTSSGAAGLGQTSLEVYDGPREDVREALLDCSQAQTGVLKGYGAV